MCARMTCVQYGRTPMHYAAALDAQLYDELLKLGADVNLADKVPARAHTHTPVADGRDARAGTR